MGVKAFDVLVLRQLLQVQGQLAEGLQQAGRSVIGSVHGAVPLCDVVIVFVTEVVEDRTPGGRGQGLGRVSMAGAAAAILQMQEVAHGPVALFAYAWAGRSVISIGSEFDAQAALARFALRQRV
ncbi:Golgi transport complex component Cog5 [Pseudomonas sp. Os17]|nr:Golgi transport complex component Cog5 [Pseudomonas sp. Os17]